MVSKADRNLFGHMIIALPLTRLLLQESQRNQHQQLKILENTLRSCIIGMSLVQTLKADDKTFREIAASLLSLLLHKGGSSKQTDGLFDVYQKNKRRDAVVTQQVTLKGRTLARDIMLYSGDSF